MPSVNVSPSAISSGATSSILVSQICCVSVAVPVTVPASVWTVAIMVCSPALFAAELYSPLPLMLPSEASATLHEIT
jgi:hypothetical protein